MLVVLVLVLLLDLQGDGGPERRFGLAKTALTDLGVGVGGVEMAGWVSRGLGRRIGRRVGVVKRIVVGGCGAGVKGCVRLRGDGVRLLGRMGGSWKERRLVGGFSQTREGGGNEIGTVILVLTNVGSQKAGSWIRISGQCASCAGGVA